MCKEHSIVGKDYVLCLLGAEFYISVRVVIDKKKKISHDTYLDDGIYKS